MTGTSRFGTFSTVNSGRRAFQRLLRFAESKDQLAAQDVASRFVRKAEVLAMLAQLLARVVRDVLIRVAAGRTEAVQLFRHHPFPSCVVGRAENKPAARGKHSNELGLRDGYGPRPSGKCRFRAVTAGGI